MVYHLYRCFFCRYEMDVVVAMSYRCPACQHEMAYITSRDKKES